MQESVKKTGVPSVPETGPLVIPVAGEIFTFEPVKVFPAGWITEQEPFLTFFADHIRVVSPPGRIVFGAAVIVPTGLSTLISISGRSYPSAPQESL